MRTTLEIDDDVLRAAKERPNAKAVPLERSFPTWNQRELHCVRDGTGIHQRPNRPLDLSSLMPLPTINVAFCFAFKVFEMVNTMLSLCPRRTLGGCGSDPPLLRCRPTSLQVGLGSGHKKPLSLYGQRFFELLEPTPSKGSRLVAVTG